MSDERKNAAVQDLLQSIPSQILDRVMGLQVVRFGFRWSHMVGGYVDIPAPLKFPEAMEYLVKRWGVKWWSAKLCFEDGSEMSFDYGHGFTDYNGQCQMPAADRGVKDCRKCARLCSRRDSRKVGCPRFMDRQRLWSLIIQNLPIALFDDKLRGVYHRLLLLGKEVLLRLPEGETVRGTLDCGLMDWMRVEANGDHWLIDGEAAPQIEVQVLEASGISPVAAKTIRGYSLPAIFRRCQGRPCRIVLPSGKSEEGTPTQCYTTAEVMLLPPEGASAITFSVAEVRRRGILDFSAGKELSGYLFSPAG